MPLVECVPNFSEGRNQKVIDAIAAAICDVEGVSLLDVDPGKATNRTVMTFVGEPNVVVEAAFRAIARAAETIDMRQHKGEHPRMGATDVCPFIPVSDITMEECVVLAKQLGERVGVELGIPVYLYAEAAQAPERRNLADVRKGEYEGLSERMKDPSFKPDFGPSQFNATAGATVIGARPFLIAYNVNLNTRSKKLAGEIALNIREGGRAARDQSGRIIKDENGQTVTVPGTLKACRAVGWYIDEYKRAQVSINLIDYRITPLHAVFDECCRQADKLGLRVTGSELVGLIPLAPMLDAGRHYLEKQGRSAGVPDAELIEVAVQSLGLAELSPFDPQKKIIEYTVQERAKALTQLSVIDFADEVSSETPAPGGGSVAALAGSLSASLSAMVANLTHAKKEFADRQLLMNNLAVQAQKLKARLLSAVDEDTQAFNRIIDARRLPKDNPEAAAHRSQAMRQANEHATAVPLGVLRKAVELAELSGELITQGNPNSVSDAAVASAMAAACAEGAYYNVLINLQGIEDDDFTSQKRQEAEHLYKQVLSRCAGDRQIVLSQLQPKQVMI